MSPAPKTRYPWRFEVCKACGRNNVAGFRVTDAMWERVMGGRGFGVVCIFCFDAFAAERGIDWTEEPIEFYCVSTVANDKWAAVEDPRCDHAWNPALIESAPDGGVVCRGCARGAGVRRGRTVGAVRYRKPRIPMLNVARTWCGQFRRRGDGHNMMFCAACNASRRRFWKAIRG